MEQAILETLKFFKAPLKAYQVHKWLNKKAKLRQVESELLKMYQKGKVDYKDGKYSLMVFKKDVILGTNEVRTSESRLDSGQARMTIGYKLKINRLKRNSDVRLISTDCKDLYIINGSKSLAIKPHNKETAYFLLKMKVLYQKDGVYSQVLEENSWVFKFFPNWTSSVIYSGRS